MRTMRIAAFIGIGSNLGDAQTNVRQAILRLSKLPQTAVSAQSALFRTAPVDADGDEYVNAVVCLDTGLAPDCLLAELQAVENEFGRMRPYRNAPRTLDLDILLYGQHVISTPDLVIPHPRMTHRAFAIIPLLEIDPLINIPGHGAAHEFVPSITGQFIQKI